MAVAVTYAESARHGVEQPSDDPRHLHEVEESVRHAQHFVMSAKLHIEELIRRQERAGSQRGGHTGPTILVVDDEPDLVHLVSFRLEREGYRVLSASDGKTGLTLALAHVPDLVILDVMMPGMNGHDVARALRADPATEAIPIVMLSAKGQAGEVAEGLQSGARAYLVKPFVPQELAARVAEALTG